MGNVVFNYTTGSIQDAYSGNAENITFRRMKKSTAISYSEPFENDIVSGNDDDCSIFTRGNWLVFNDCFACYSIPTCIMAYGIMERAFDCKGFVDSDLFIVSACTYINRITGVSTVNTILNVAVNGRGYDQVL